MRIFILAFIISMAFLSGPPAYARGILVVQNYKIKPYEEALKGFKSSCCKRINNPVYHELESSGNIVEAVRRTHPELILAIGMEALAKAIIIKSIPIVYVMVLNPQTLVHGEKNITGVSMNISPEKHFSVLHKLLPTIKTIGVIYDPRRNGTYIKKALYFAKTEGIELIAKEVNSPKEVPEALENLRGKVDLLWILPDITVITPETTDFLLLFSLQNKIPIHVFSDKYLEMGAFSSLETNPFNMGEQAGEIAAKIFSGMDVPEIERTYSTNPQLAVNLKVAKKLGLAIDPQVLSKATIIR
jgi:putative ABC transport system substrate-binding protein